MTGPATGYAVTGSGRVLRYEARPAECGVLPVFPSAGSGGIPLQPLLRWQPAPGGTDGYRIALGTSAGAQDLLSLTDVGLDTFFLMPQALPANTTVYVSIYPYNQYFGEAGCHDAFSLTTAACPVPTVLEAAICKNGSLLFADSLITAAGFYEWTYALPSGCDSLVQLAVSQYPDVVTTIDTTLLIGQPFNGIVYGQDTTLEFVLQTVNGCDSLVRVNLQLVTGTKEPRKSLMAVQLFPNPAAESVTLRFKQVPSGAMRLYLFNEAGQTVLRQKLSAQQDHNIDLSGLPAGSYRVVVMVNGQVVAVRKLVLI